MNRALLFPVFILALAACDRGDQTATLTPREAPRSTTPDDATVSDAARFGFDSPKPMGADQAAAQPTLAWDIPPDWTTIPPQQFRNPNFKLDKVEGGEAYITLLPGGGGGPMANLQRWRSQFGQQPLTQDQITSLARLTVLAQPAILLDQTGVFAGMGQDQPRENWRLIGCIVELPAALITVKMTGPAAALDAELQHFKAFCQSLRMAAPAAGLPPGHPAIDPALLSGAAPAAESGFEWTVPAGWKQGPDREMRLATLLVGEGGQTDVSLIVLKGAAGGKVANVQMWYQQMGSQAPQPDQIEKLTTIKVLDRDAVLVEADGDFSGMGREPLAQATLLGVICEMPDQTLFVKMVGPRDEVRAQREAFVNFCLSLKQK